MSRDERRDIIVAPEAGSPLQIVKAWPIFERENGGAIMYYMIHATDHPEAPKFMSRAYRRAGAAAGADWQLTLDLFSEGDDFAEQATKRLWRTSKLFPVVVAVWDVNV